MNAKKPAPANQGGLPVRSVDWSGHLSTPIEGIARANSIGFSSRSSTSTRVASSDLGTSSRFVHWILETRIPEALVPAKLPDLSTEQLAALARLRGTHEYRALGMAAGNALNELVIKALAVIRFDVAGNLWYQLSPTGLHLRRQLDSGICAEACKRVEERSACGSD